MPNQLPAFRQLQNFIGEQTARKPRKHTTGPKSETANNLTRRIVQHVRANGGFATRLNSTGTYRADLKKFVQSQQVSGMPDVLACVNGQFVGIEIKAGKDRLSDAQKQTIAALEKAGASVYVAHDFEGFNAWFNGQLFNPAVRMIPALVIAALLACFEILLQVLTPDKQQPAPPPTDAEEDPDALPFGPAPAKMTKPHTTKTGLILERIRPVKTHKFNDCNA